MAANDQQLQVLIGINKQLHESEESTRRLGKLNDRLGGELNSILRATTRYASLVEEITTLEASGLKTVREQVKINNRVKDLGSEIVLLKIKEKKYKDDLNFTEKEALKNLKFHIQEQKRLNGNINIQDELISKINKKTPEGMKELAWRTKQVGVLSKGIIDNEKEIETIVRKNANVLQPLLIEQQLEKLKLVDGELKTLVKEITLREKLIGIAKEYRKEILNGLGGLLKGAAALAGITLTVGGLFKVMKEGFFEVDNSVTNITKSSGLSKDISEQLLKTYRGIQDGTVAISGNLNFALATTKNLLAAQQELQASTELSALFTKGSTESQLYLTKQLSMSAEEAAKLNSLSLINKQTTEDTVKAAYDQVEALAKSNGVRLQGRVVLREVAKIEGVISANYNNNPKKLIEAVALTKSLGTNLQAAANASRSLLDFETSIESELEAELLTGRRFNLEKARSLALDGDSAAAVKEMLANVGSLQDFQRQNVLAKEAEAKAVGMTVDELANALRQQELIKSLSIEDRNARDEILERVKGTADFDKYRAQLNAATSAQELRAAEQSIGKQEKFNSLIDKLKDKVVEMGDPLLKFVTSFEHIIENAQRFSGILKGIAVIMSGIAVAATIASFGANLAAAGIAIGGTALTGAVVGGGIAAGVGSAVLLNDGVVDPNGGIVLSTPKGQIKTNKDDYIVATTDPASLLGGGGSGKTDQLLSAILSAVSKPSGVYIDSYRAGTALGISNSAFA